LQSPLTEISSNFALVTTATWAWRLILKLNKWLNFLPKFQGSGLLSKIVILVNKKTFGEEVLVKKSKVRNIGENGHFNEVDP